MKLLHLFLGIALSVLCCVRVGDALQCYQCQYVFDTSGGSNDTELESGNTTCVETFTAINTTMCEESEIYCTRSVTKGKNYIQVERGCASTCSKCIGKKMTKDYERAVISDCCTDNLCNGASSVSHITKTVISIFSLLLITFICY